MANLIEYIPEHLREYDAVQELMTALQPEADALEAALNMSWNAQTIQTAPAETLTRWEDALGIPFNEPWRILPDDSEADKETKRQLNLNYRRARILVRMQLEKPYGMDDITRLINAEGSIGSIWTYEYDRAARSLVIKMAGSMYESGVQRRYIERMVKTMLPASTKVTIQKYTP